MSAKGNATRLDLAPEVLAALIGAVDVAGALSGRDAAGAGDASAPGVETSAQREVAFSALQGMGRVNGHDLILTSPAVLGLMRLGASDTCRLPRADLVGQNGSGRSSRMSMEDLRMLLGLGYVEERTKWVEITDAGNEMVRALLAFARGWKGGAAKP